MAKLAAEMRAEQERLGSLQPRDIRQPTDAHAAGARQVESDDAQREPVLGSWDRADGIAEEAPEAVTAARRRVPLSSPSPWMWSLAAGVLGAFVGAAGAWLLTAVAPADRHEENSALVGPASTAPGDPQGATLQGATLQGATLQGNTGQAVLVPELGVQSADPGDAAALAAASIEIGNVPQPAVIAAELADSPSPQALAPLHERPRSSVQAVVYAPPPPAIKAKLVKSAAKVPRPKPRPTPPLATETVESTVPPAPVVFPGATIEYPPSLSAQQADRRCTRSATAPFRPVASRLFLFSAPTAEPTVTEGPFSLAEKISLVTASCGRARIPPGRPVDRNSRCYRQGCAGIPFWI